MCSCSLFIVQVVEMFGRVEERLRVIGAPEGVTEGSTMLEKWSNHLKKFSNLMEEDYKENREVSFQTGYVRELCHCVQDEGRF